MLPLTPTDGPVSSIADLLQAARSDPDALGRLLESYRGYLAELAHGRPVRARNWLTDSVLIQDTLLAACRHFAAFRGSTSADLARWLGVILRRMAATQNRTATARAEAGRVDGQALETLPDPAAAPEDVTAAGERDAAVRAVVEILPDDYRTALDLRFHDRLSFEEIGRRMDRSAEAARKLVVRALGQAGGRLTQFR